MSAGYASFLTGSGATLKCLLAPKLWLKFSGRMSSAQPKTWMWEKGSCRASGLPNFALGYLWPQEAILAAINRNYIVLWPWSLYTHYTSIVEESGIEPL